MTGMKPKTLESFNLQNWNRSRGIHDCRKASPVLVIRTPRFLRWLKNAINLIQESKKNTFGSLECMQMTEDTSKLQYLQTFLALPGILRAAILEKRYSDRDILSDPSQKQVGIFFVLFEFHGLCYHCVLFFRIPTCSLSTKNYVAGALQLGAQPILYSLQAPSKECLTLSGGSIPSCTASSAKPLCDFWPPTTNASLCAKLARSWKIALMDCWASTPGFFFLSLCTGSEVEVTEFLPFFRNSSAKYFFARMLSDTMKALQVPLKSKVPRFSAQARAEEITDMFTRSFLPKAWAVWVPEMKFAGPLK